MDLQEFIRKAREKESKKLKITQIEIEGFGLVEFQRPALKDILNYVDDISNATETEIEVIGETEEGEPKTKETVKNQDMKKILEASSKFVYLSCSLLRSKEVRAEFKVGDPYELPVEVFGFDEVIEVAGEILEVFNGNKEIKKIDEEIKN